jgi:glycosyltransferase involved in cell wall biosynthesis
MQVAIALKTFPPDAVGGMETQTKQMATKLQNAGHDITVFTKQFGDHDDSDLPYDVVRVRNLQFSSFLSDLTFLVFALIEIVRRRNEFDLLQCMMIYPLGFLGYVVNKLTGLPYFAWIRGGDYYLMNNVGWKRWMMRQVLTDTLVLAQSDEIRQDVTDDFRTVDCDIKVLGNAVSIPDSTADGDGVLYLGRLASKKGLKYLVTAMADIEATLTIVGDGPERDKLEALATEIGVDTTFVGEVPPDAVDRYYESAAVFVLPSTEGEGMPNAVLEAMSWGLPVVATDSGGLPTVINDGTTGYIVPMRDPDALQAKIIELLDNPRKRQQIGNSARKEVIVNYSWDSIVDNLNTIYKNVVRSSVKESSE